MYKKVEKDYSSKIEELEKNSWVLLNKKYKRLTDYDYNKLIEDWDIYYQIVKEDSPMYALYKDTYKAVFFDKDLERAKYNGKLASEWLVNGNKINSPSEEDPRVVERKDEVMTYYRLKNNKQSNNFDI